MRDSTQLHFKFALFAVGLSLGFIATMAGSLALYPVEQPSSEIVLRPHVVPSGLSI